MKKIYAFEKISVEDYINQLKNDRSIEAKNIIKKLESNALDFNDYDDYVALMTRLEYDSRDVYSIDTFIYKQQQLIGSYDLLDGVDLVEVYTTVENGAVKVSGYMYVEDIIYGI